MAETAPSDGDLVRRCRAGDDAAWAALVERFSRYVYAICVQGFRLSQQDAEDAFQDVFARAFVQLATLRDVDAVRPWLGQLTRRTCIDLLRRTRTEVPVDELEVAADELLESLTAALAVRQALEALGEPCSDMLDRFFAQDQSYRTIGEQLGLPSGTIASRISRCLEKLRASMEDSGLDPRPEKQVI